MRRAPAPAVHTGPVTSGTQPPAAGAAMLYPAPLRPSR